MEVQKIIISCPHGIHLREAARIVRTTKKFKSKVYLCQNCKLVDSCSILEVLGLAVKEGSEVAVIVEGMDEKQALNEIVQVFNYGLGI